MNSNVNNLVEETARRLSVAPADLEVFIRRFVQLANDQLEEAIGFHSLPARRACAALSELVQVDEVPKALASQSLGCFDE